MIFFTLVGRYWHRLPIYKCVRGDDDDSRYYMYNDDQIGQHGGWLIVRGATSLELNADMRLMEPYRRLPYWGDDIGYEDPSRPGMYMWQEWVPGNPVSGSGDWRELETPLEHVTIPEAAWDSVIGARHVELVLMGR